MTCYKQDSAPESGAGGPTERWRTLGKKHRRAEQKLLGVQYNEMLTKPIPLVVRESKRWFWSGTGLRDGDELPDLVAVEADGFNPSVPRPENTEQALLSESPYNDSMGRGRGIQNNRPLALSEPENLDPQVQRATRNLMDRMWSPRG